MHLINFDPDIFLRDYWQKKPLLIRNSWDAWCNPLEPDELAGLACEDDVESRLITRADHHWTVEHGPIAETRFAALDESAWTLLVQAVDHFVPDVAALIAPFRFIPNWRIDDVMVSYATDGGGVGPHFDQYDVFLIQGLGQRRWQVGAHDADACTANTPLLQHDDLRLLAAFTPVEDWVLNPGDILYVPPGVAHNGIAVGDDCMTYSIGFRAPARSELIAHFCDYLLSNLQEDDRYTDPNLKAQSNPGEISADALAQLRTMITDKLSDHAMFARWFGEFSSTPKNPEREFAPDKHITIKRLRGAIGLGRTLTRNPASRFVFIRQAPDLLDLFVDGECYRCANETIVLAEQLCAESHFKVPPAFGTSEAALAMLTTFINTGSLYLGDRD